MVDRERALFLLSPEGPFASNLSDYEDRPSQREMLLHALHAYNDELISFIEAPTGTGKSLAYLLAAVLWQKETGERTVVATHTKTLQDQLGSKDAPDVAGILDQKLKVAVVKGRGNYLCLRKFEELRSTRGSLPGLDGAVEALFAWSLQTATGDFSEFSGEINEALWTEIHSEADDCVGRRCPHHDRCFVQRLREEAEKANVVVTNHALLLLDGKLRKESEGAQSLLPEAHRFVVDEAHHLEEEALRAFSSEADRKNILRLLNRLAPSRRDRRKGLVARFITRLEGEITSPDAPAMVNAQRLLMRVGQTSALLQDEFQALFRLLDPYLLKSAASLRITLSVAEEERWLREVRPQLCQIADRLFVLGREIVQASRVGNLLGELPPLLEGAARELKGAGLRLQDAAGVLSSVADGEKENEVVWIEREVSGELRFHCGPVEVGEALCQALFQPAQTVLLTSATLSVGTGFEFFTERLGLARLRERLEGHRLASPFDWREQAAVAVAADLPSVINWQKNDYVGRLSEFLLDLLPDVNGGALVLFTSYQMLRATAETMRRPLEEMNRRILVQGEQNRTELLHLFREDLHSVLLGTNTFWEGIDAPGDALRLLVITRLPFAVPDDPVHQAQSEQLLARGKDPFRHLALPLAVLRFKQGLGRLIRRRSDRGAVLITDARIASKSYGRLFRASLPDLNWIEAGAGGIKRAILPFL